MNDHRRKQLKDLYDKLSEIKTELDSICTDEEDYRENIPENLQEGMNAQKSDEAITEMEQASESIDEAMNSIQNAFE